MTWTEPSECRICGNTNHHEVRVSLAHWREAEPGMAYEHVARCVDRVACRARVDQAGESWPLVTDSKDISRAS